MHRGSSSPSREGESVFPKRCGVIISNFDTQNYQKYFAQSFQIHTSQPKLILKTFSYLQRILQLSANHPVSRSEILRVCIEARGISPPARKSEILSASSTLDAETTPDLHCKCNIPFAYLELNFENMGICWVRTSFNAGFGFGGIQ